jgi:hypothetical protein
LIDLLKLADEHDTEEKKEAVKYLEQAHARKEEFIAKVVGTMSDRITKDELTEKLRTECFHSFRLRMAIAGLTWLSDAEVLAKKIEAKAAHAQTVLI